MWLQWTYSIWYICTRTWKKSDIKQTEWKIHNLDESTPWKKKWFAFSRTVVIFSVDFVLLFPPQSNFMALSRIFHLYQADNKAKVGENPKLPENKHLTFRKQNVTFSLARLKPTSARDPMFRNLGSYHLGHRILPVQYPLLDFVRYSIIKYMYGFEYSSIFA